MSFTLETIPFPNKADLITVFNQFELSDNKDSDCYELGKSEEVEKDLINNIQRAIDNKTRLHILYDERTTTTIACGVIALNFEMVGEFSALSIDLLFISKPYRGIHFDEINSKISYYLLDFALQEAITMNKISQLDAVLLTAINKCVKEVYLEYGFDEFADDWLYLLVDDIP